MIVFKTHVLGEDGSSLTLMQSREVRINAKCCDAGLGERQDSLLIATAPRVTAACTPLLCCVNVLPAGGMGVSKQLCEQHHLQHKVFPLECGGTSSSCPLMYSCLCPRLMEKP